MKKFIAIAVAAYILTGCASKEEKHLSVIPEPVNVSIEKGDFIVSDNTLLCLKNLSYIDPTAQYIKEYLSKWMNLTCDFSEIPTSNKNFILFEILDSPDSIIGNEGYLLSVTKNNITVSANTTAGLFYGFQTLFQLTPPDIVTTKPESFSIPCMSISDYPRFEWRGSHLDVCRHFFDVDFVKKHLDILAMNKINKFHWHLTDDQGWRIQIDQYPKLTEIGACRVDRTGIPWREIQPPQKDETATDCNYYTKEQIREIVEYADQRHIDVIPEIELPGHSSAILAAYPEFACDKYPYCVEPGSYWPPKAILCGGNDDVITFLKNVLSEVAEIFPYKYIHIGGDEAYKDNWKVCPKCQKRIKELNLKNEEELQNWMTFEIEKHAHSIGKEIIGWDEILEGGVSKTAVVMSWRGIDGGIEAAKYGNNVIMAPNTYVYLDYYQADPTFQPEAIGGYLPLHHVYEFDPVPQALSEEQAKYIKGGQCNLWTEYINTPDYAEYMLHPRLGAVAECVWSPKEVKDWINFKNKIVDYKIRLASLNYNFCEGEFKPVISTTTENSKLMVSIDSEVAGTDIYYTLDGNEPNTNSSLYTKPFEVTGSHTIKAATFYNGEKKHSTSSIEVFTSKMTGKNITLSPQPSEKYNAQLGATLCDGILASTNYNDGKWLGFQTDKVDIIVANNAESIQKLFLYCLVDQNGWIFAPKEVEISVSDDETDFTTISSQSFDTEQKVQGATTQKFDFDFGQKITPTFIKITLKGLNALPENHTSAGKMPWLFIDEIVTI